MPLRRTTPMQMWPVALAATIALIGCSGTGSFDAGSTSLPTGTTVANASGLAPATTIASSTGSPTASAAPGLASVTPAARSYCDAAMQAQAATDAFNALGADPESTADPAAVFDAYVATINTLAASAPAELVADLQRNGDAMAKLKPILAAVGYDVAKAFEDPAINTILTAEVNAGSQRINEYNASTCGLSGVNTATSLPAP